jgi:hypothetical protein
MGSESCFVGLPSFIEGRNTYGSEKSNIQAAVCSNTTTHFFEYHFELMQAS